MLSFKVQEVIESTTMQRNLYEDWQLALQNYFFAEEKSRFILYVDEMTLQTIAKSTDCLRGFNDPVLSLRQAVKSKTTMALVDRIFHHTNSLVADWRRGAREEAPPVLPILALSVLAASMRSGHESYYQNFAELLAGEYDDVRVIYEYLSKGNSYYPIIDYWKTLDEWINHTYGEGFSTIASSRHFQRIGYALSQSFMNFSDQNRILEMFSGHQPPNKNEIDRRVSIEMTRTNHFSKSFSKAFMNGKIREMMLDTCVSLVASGRRSLQPANLKKGRIDLMIDDESYEPILKIELDDSADRLVGTSSPGQEIFLVREPGTQYFLLESSAVSGYLGLESSLKFVLKDKAYSRTNGSYIFMVKEPILGIYQEVPLQGLNEPALVLVENGSHIKFRELLQTNDELKYSGCDKGLKFGLKDYTLFYDVKSTNGKYLEELITENYSLKIARNGLNDKPQAALAGGLNLSNEANSKRVFLAGGEPSIDLPKLSTSQPTVLDINGQKQEFSANGSRIDIRMMNLTVPGLNRVFVGSQDLSFYVEEPYYRSISNQNKRKQVIDHSRVVMVGRYSDGTFALLENGDVKQIGTPRVSPSWKLIYPDMDPIFFEYAPRPDEKWIIQRIGATWKLCDISKPRDEWLSAKDVDVPALWREANKNPESFWAWEWFSNELRGVGND